MVNVNTTGDLGKYGVQLPTASSGLKVNIGAEWRDVYSQNTPDEEFATGDLSGQGGAKPGVAGGIISREAFREARLPILEDMPFAKALDVEDGYRYSDYSLGFKTNTYKFGVDWAPTSDVRFRGTFDRAVRAPNVVELFSPQSVALDGNTDPCAGAAVGGLVNGYTAAQCARTGVTRTTVRSHHTELRCAIQRLDRRQSGPAAGNGADFVVRYSVDPVVHSEPAREHRLLQHQD